MPAPTKQEGLTAREVLIDEWSIPLRKDVSAEVFRQPELDAATISAETDKRLGEAQSAGLTTDKDSNPIPPELSALCLSGGGIRSATFSLGVLQALADKKWLENFNYLSTVSGGGFTGSWLTRWRAAVAEEAEKSTSVPAPSWSQDHLKETPDQYSGAHDSLHPVRRLRSFSNYLAPRVGMTRDSFTFVNSVLRKFGFNLITWILTFLAIAALCQAVIAIAPAISANSALSPNDLPEFFYDPTLGTTLTLPAFVFLLMGLFTVATLLLQRSDFIGQEIFSAHVAQGILFFLGWIVVFVFFAVIPDYLWDKGGEALARSGNSTQAVSIGLYVVISGAITALVGLWTRIPQQVQAHARGLTNRLKVYSLELVSLATLALFAISSGYFLRWVFASPGFYNWLPIPGFQQPLIPAPWRTQCPDAIEETAADANPYCELDQAYDPVREASDNLEKLTQTGAPAAEIVEAKQVLDSARQAVVGADGPLDSYRNAAQQMEIAAYDANIWQLWAVALVLAIAAFFFAILVGVNRSSLHSIYSVRLVRAFLGSARKGRQPSMPSGYDRKDDLLLHKMPFRNADGKLMLFPVVNMTLNLKRGRGERNDWQERNGAPFVATPLHVGSPALNTWQNNGSEDANGTPDGRGYFPTRSLVWNEEEVQATMTLGRAMTISGAAASPNMGYYSRPIVMAAMAILNIRLGWWFPNPRYHSETPSWWHRNINEPFVGLLYFLKEAAGMLKDTDRWLYLSDGGHFDNLGLYEMVRRRCRRILVIDAGADPDFLYEDLLSTVRKIRVDFGVPIDLPSALPGQDGIGKDQRFVTGTIRYSVANKAHADGKLVILKPMLRGTEPPGLLRYREESRASNGEFPHHKTTDQFFDESQFENYRLLGDVSAREMIKHLGESWGLSAKLLTDIKPYPGADEKAEQPRFEEEDGAAPAQTVARRREDGMPEREGGNSFTGLLESFAGSLQNMSTGELMLKTAGVVAATAATVTVADGTVRTLPDVPDIINEYIFQLAPPTPTDSGTGTGTGTGTDNGTDNGEDGGEDAGGQSEGEQTQDTEALTKNDLEQAINELKISINNAVAAHDASGRHNPNIAPLGPIEDRLDDIEAQIAKLDDDFVTRQEFIADKGRQDQELANLRQQTGVLRRRLQALAES